MTIADNDDKVRSWIGGAHPTSVVIDDCLGELLELRTECQALRVVLKASYGRVERLGQQIDTAHAKIAEFIDGENKGGAE